MVTRILSTALVAAVMCVCGTLRAATLINHWAFEETSGPTVADSQGGDDPGTVNGGVDLNVSGAPGFGSGARFLNNTDLPITIAGNSIQDTFGGNATQFSITGWFLLEGSQNRYTYGSANFNQFTMNLSGTTLLQVDRIGNAIEHRSITAASIAGAWHHVALVNTADGTFDYYVDGVLQTNVTNDNVLGGSLASTPIIGGATGYAGSRTYFGSMDELKTWQGALTPAEILADMVAPSTANSTPEPSALLLAIVSVVSMTLFSRRRQGER